MTTQKKYHNLVLLDKSSAEHQQDVSKPISVAFLFIAGIAVGAIFISLLYEDYAVSQVTSTATLSSLHSISDSSTQEITPMELQSITETTTAISAKSLGCSIESLGRNIPEQGCSADDYKDIAVNSEPDNATGITSLGNLPPSEGGLIKTDTLQGVTNILDLQ
ncbi:MAG: hypothetical protein KAG34_11010 [Cocleimonas sp.]|nr:hypothetical protein [Cocleimonas sp.]